MVLIRKLWSRLFLRRLGYRTPTRKLRMLYRVSDPWNLGSEKEQKRFEATNEFIESRLGHVGSLLEIGCGEGHQSVYLRRLTDRLIGIEISDRAVARARERCPDAEFESGELGAWSPKPDETFDLVTACEVLYYMKDVRASMQRLLDLGRATLVTYYEGQAPTLDPILDELGESFRTSFSFGGTTWHARLWLRGT